MTELECINSFTKNQGYVDKKNNCIDNTSLITYDITFYIVLYSRSMLCNIPDKIHIHIKFQVDNNHVTLCFSVFACRQFAYYLSAHLQ